MGEKNLPRKMMDDFGFFDRKPSLFRFFLVVEFSSRSWKSEDEPILVLGGVLSTEIE